MSELALGGIERVSGLDGEPQYYIVKFEARLPADEHGRRNNLSGSVRVDIPWQPTAEEFEQEAMSAVQDFLRKVAGAFAPA